MSKLHHIGIILPDQSLLEMWLQLLQAKVVREYFVEEYGAHCIFCALENVAIEFIVPTMDSVLSKYNRGIGGIHHIALEVDSIDAERDVLNDTFEAELLEAVNVNAGPININFLPPLLTRGVIIEYVEKNE